MALYLYVNKYKLIDFCTARIFYENKHIFFQSMCSSFTYNFDMLFLCVDIVIQNNDN